MTTDYRAMCAELTTALEYAWDGRRPKVVQELIDRARGLLAQPVAEGPSASDVTELFYRHMGEGSEVGFENAIAEALTRFGHPTPQPVAKRPTVMEIIELHSWLEDEWRANNDGEDLPTVDFALALLAKWGHQ